MKYFIDFDGTICPNSGNEPHPDCINVLKRLKQFNHTIHIYSCRSNPACVDDANTATQEMKEYLDLYGVPYDTIESGKPYFNFLIDDRAVGVPLTSKHDVDWTAIKKHLGI